MKSVFEEQSIQILSSRFLIEFLVLAGGKDPEITVT
jgi:hypothetical protein